MKNLMTKFSCCSSLVIGIGSNSILGGPNVIYSAIAAICAACMNINKVSRVKYWEGGPARPSPPCSYAYVSYMYMVDKWSMASCIFLVKFIH